MEWLDEAIERARAARAALDRKFKDLETERGLQDLMQLHGNRLWSGQVQASLQLLYNKAIDDEREECAKIADRHKAYHEALMIAGRRVYDGADDDVAGFERFAVDCADGIAAEIRARVLFEPKREEGR